MRFHLAAISAAKIEIIMPPNKYNAMAIDAARVLQTRFPFLIFDERYDDAYLYAHLYFYARLMPLAYR